jgi:hypothetical protein
MYWGADRDLPGKDYKSFVVDTRDLKSGQEPRFVCREACQEDKKCRAWTFVRPSPREGRPVGRCYLKHDLPKEVHKRGHDSGWKHFFCEKVSKFSFTTKSPIPPAVIGGHYNFQMNTSGGIRPVEFCAMQRDPRGAPPRCDNSPHQNFSMPLGLRLSKTGLISGQVKCGPGPDLSKCKEAHIPILVQASDNCPNSPRRITGEFWIHIENPMAGGN